MRCHPSSGEPDGSPVRGTTARASPDYPGRCPRPAHDRRPGSGGRRARRGCARARHPSAWRRETRAPRSSAPWPSWPSPSPSLLSPPGRVVSAIAYAVAARVEFEVGSGFAVPTQVVFVPMLFLLPVGLVPLCVAVGFLLCAALDVARRRMHGERALLEVFSAWHALGPALVLAAAGEPRGRSLCRCWPSCSSPSSPSTSPAPRSERAARSTSPPGRGSGSPRPSTSWTPRSRRPASSSRSWPTTSRSPSTRTPAPRPLRLLRARAHRRIDHALELSHAYRGTAFLLGDVIEADDAYTGSHSRDVVKLVVGVSAQLGLDARFQQDAELTASHTTWGRSASPRRSSTSRAS